MPVELTRLRFGVDEYHRMAKAGILSEDDRVELIDGEIIVMSPAGSLHSGTVNKLTRSLSRALGDEAVIGVHDPIRLTDDTEPEPDLAVLRPRADFYTESLPTPVGILLVVEVADTSLLADRMVKLPRYARAGIGEAWLVDLENGRIERHGGPEYGGYRDVTMIERGQRLASTVVEGLVLTADEILRAA